MIYNSLNEEQQEKYLLNNNELFSNTELDEKKITKNNYDKIIRQINEHSYIISIDKLQQNKEFHLEKSTLTDIHTDIIHNKDKLSTNQGFIYIKEYTLDCYECRCEKHENLLNDNEEINNDKHSFNYKLKF